MTTRLFISLDAELAWGGVHDVHPPDVSSEMLSVKEDVYPWLVEEFERYEIPTMWMFVGALIDPSWSGDDVLRVYPREVLHAPELGDLVRQSSHQRLGLHGYTHKLFTDLSEDEQDAEIDSAVEVLKSTYGVTHVPFAFPRNAEVRLSHESRKKLAYVRPTRFRERRPGGAADAVRRMLNGAVRSTPLQLAGRGKSLDMLNGSMLPPGAYAPEQLMSLAIWLRQDIHLWFHPFNLLDLASRRRFSSLLENVADQQANGRLEIVDPQAIDGQSLGVPSGR